MSDRRRTSSSSKPSPTSSARSTPTPTPKGRHRGDDDDDRDVRTGGDDHPPVDDGRRIVGRLRNYLNEDNGRDFDPEDPRTPEGRLVDSHSASWYVPAGKELHLRRPGIGKRARDVQAGDVGRFRMSDFTTRATNDHDHQDSLRLEVPKQMVNELRAIVDSKVFPTRNVQSLARTLLWEGLQVLQAIARQDNLYIPNSHPQQIEALAIINRDAASVLEYDDMLDRMCEMARELMRRGIRNKARTMVHEALDVVKTITVGELRRRWQRDIENEFRDVLKGRPAQVHPMRRATDKPSVDDDED